jgi:hypothetical protein
MDVATTDDFLDASGNGCDKSVPATSSMVRFRVVEPPEKAGCGMTGVSYLLTVKGAPDLPGLWG